MSLYPSEFTPLNEMFHTTDFAKTKLIEDIMVLPERVVVETTERFPREGIITITSNPGRLISKREEDWAMSFYYTDVTDKSFEGLSLVKGNFSPKYRGELVTLNVISDHHNKLTEEVMNLERVGGTLESRDQDSLRFRIERLKRHVRKPRAFFSLSKCRGFAPFTVEFKDMSTRRPEKWLWSFGDGHTSPQQNPIHTFIKPGVYTIILTVFNDYGTDTFECKEIIQALGVPALPPSIKAKTRRGIIGEPLLLEGITADRSQENQFQSWVWVLHNQLKAENSEISARKELGHNVFETPDPFLSITADKGGIYPITLMGRSRNGSLVSAKESLPIKIIEETNLWDYRIQESAILPYEYGLNQGVYSVGTPLRQIVSGRNPYDSGYLKSNIDYNGILYIQNNSNQNLEFHEYNGFFMTWNRLPNLGNTKQNSLNINTFKDKIYVINSIINGEPQTDIFSYNLNTRMGPEREWSTNYPTIGEREFTSTTRESDHPGIYYLTKVLGSYWNEFQRLDPYTGIISHLTSVSDPPGETLSTTGANIKSRNSRLHNMKKGIYLFGPAQSVARYEIETGAWGSDKAKDLGFQRDNPIIAGGNEEICFIEQSGQRYMNRYTSLTGVMDSLETTSGVPLTKGVY